MIECEKAANIKLQKQHRIGTIRVRMFDIDHAEYSLSYNE